MEKIKMAEENDDLHLLLITAPLGNMKKRQKRRNALNITVAYNHSTI
jgi:inosine-uridine nucleoside N-ribohydrolase